MPGTWLGPCCHLPTAISLCPSLVAPVALQAPVLRPLLSLQFVPGNLPLLLVSSGLPSCHTRGPCAGRPRPHFIAGTPGWRTPCIPSPGPPQPDLGSACRRGHSPPARGSGGSPQQLAPDTLKQGQMGQPPATGGGEPSRAEMGTPLSPTGTFPNTPGLAGPWAPASLPSDDPRPPQGRASTAFCPAHGDQRPSGTFGEWRGGAGPGGPGRDSSAPPSPPGSLVAAPQPHRMDNSPGGRWWAGPAQAGRHLAGQRGSRSQPRGEQRSV